MRTETITCDLCGEVDEHYTTDKKRIEGVEYDVHSECWDDFMSRLSGKGRKVDQGIQRWITTESGNRIFAMPSVPDRHENVDNSRYSRPRALLRGFW